MKRSYTVLIIVLFCAFLPLDLDAQCSMCKAVVESNANSGGNAGSGINDGIVYLMGIPYLLIATAGYFIYKNLRKRDQQV